MATRLTAAKTAIELRPLNERVYSIDGGLVQAEMWQTPRLVVDSQNSDVVVVTASGHRMDLVLVNDAAAETDDELRSLTCSCTLSTGHVSATQLATSRC